ncbi:MAG: hypothetical protein KC620_13285 [Myxococcales bacterium]|nr:hypothetical protein [Myxococcales bacterium]
MTRRLVSGLLALAFLLPLAAWAQGSDTEVRDKLTAVVAEIAKLDTAAATNKDLRVPLRNAVVAARATQQARRGGDLANALKILADAQEIAQRKPKAPDMTALKKTHPKWIPPSDAKVPAASQIVGGKWKDIAQVQPDSIHDVAKVVPDSLIEPNPTQP